MILGISKREWRNYAICCLVVLLLLGMKNRIVIWLSDLRDWGLYYFNMGGVYFNMLIDYLFI